MARSPHELRQARPRANGYTPMSDSGKPAWVYLLIGIFLGAGGTLLSSSLWLPEVAGTSVTALEAKEVEVDQRAVAAKDIETNTGVGSKEQAEAESEELVQVAKLDLDPITEPPLPQTKSDALPSSVQNDVSTDALPQETEQRPEIVDGDKATPASPIKSEVKSETVLSRDAQATSGVTVENGGEDSRARTFKPETALAALIEKSRLAKEKGPEAPVLPPSRVTTAEEEPPLVTVAAATDGQSSRTQRSRLYRIQLAAVDDEAAARSFWREASARLPDVLGGVEPIFDRRKVNNREFFRIWIGAFDRHADAVNYCGWLQGQGQDCFVTRVDNL